ncbi:Nuclear mRNA export protein THP1 [Nakaseomyces bracarensis]|uniref:Nuclear mRNA export protein THP1 n=1 Tax=Nakaseomyces bracarensis TaxID=273131 RepID=A0ABR4NP39_9SACH
MMNYSVADLIGDLNNGVADVLSVDLARNGGRVAALQRDLQGQNDKTLDNMIDGSKIVIPGQDPKRRWTRLNILVVSFLKFCRDVDPWSTWNSVDLIFDHYSNLNNALLDDSYPVDFLTRLFLDETEYVTRISCELDSHNLQLGTKHNLFLSYTSSIISKLFNSIKPPRDGDMGVIPQKQRLLLSIVNKLNNIYFRIDSPQLCSNIFKNFKPKSMFSNFREYPILQQIEFRYLLGRYYMINFRMTNSYVQLDNAFRMICAVIPKCPGTQTQEVMVRNLKRILKYLIPVGLTIGKIPNFERLVDYDQPLANRYYDLSKHIQSGNMKMVNMWLAQYESSLRRDHLLIPLLQKLPMIVFRNLIRKVAKYAIIPQNTNKIPYGLIRKSLEVSIGDENNNMSLIYNSIHKPEDVENILVTLINLGFLRGNCFPSLEVCVVKKTQNISEVFPEVTERIIKMFPLNSEDHWFDS